MENYYVSQFKKIIAKRELPEDTFNLQWQSLCSFAESMGYEVLFKFTSLGDLQSRGFKLANPDLKNQLPDYVSFENMVKYHNTYFWPYGSALKRIVQRADEDKLVECVKLQRTKQGLKAQNHYVRLLK
ncbi:hypothetical protein KUA24_160 [Vibrio phage HNL01]|nr:hypothetical protein KUA24_160 [Vibrio phage HNL01]